MTRKSVFGALLGGAVFVGGLVAGNVEKDWPMWGGTMDRNMVSAMKGIPEKWDVASKENIRWMATLGSQSYGNPVVAEGVVLVGTNNEGLRDPKQPGDRGVLIAFRESDGEFLWQITHEKLASGRVNDWPYQGVCSSPLVENGIVYYVSNRGEVVAADLKGMANGNDGPFKGEKFTGPKDGDILWTFDMMEEVGAFQHNMANSSPVILGDIIYVSTSNGQDESHVNVPSPKAPSIIAINKKTGELLGEDDAKIGPRIFHGQWSSPSTGKVNGKDLIFFGGGDGFCYAFDAIPKKEGDGAFLKTVWKYDANPPEYKAKDGKPIKYPAAEGPSEINSTPVFWKNRIYVATGQDPEHGEGVGHLVCLDATKTGDITKTGVIWSFKGINRSISTVSIDPATGLLFVGDFSGFVYCLDSETGKLHWKHDMKAHMWSSTMVADGKVYVGDEDGDFVVLAAKGGPKAEVLSECNLGAPIYSTPVIANGVIYIASNTHLFALHDSAKAKAVKP